MCHFKALVCIVESPSPFLRVRQWLLIDPEEPRSLFWGRLIARFLCARSKEGGKLALDDVKIAYIGATFATLVIFYFLLCTKVARVHESVNQIHDAILQTSGKTLSSAEMTALLTCASVSSQPNNITGWGSVWSLTEFPVTSLWYDNQLESDTSPVRL
ncbi:hypothetical protein AVEN_66648-1 [Araneus ventricosus]|uniref:Uncharacterized protein n=1 Tax=Araneus ventricosus TaxID=182803 RepID=A0A4Y2PHT1_ARAVE|nr:hypothetical protein AVEN_66648-1 [Araneus ventricosus]